MSLSPQSIQTVKSVLDGIVAEGATGAPGLVFCAIDKAGNNLVEYATGTRGVQSQEPMDMDTTFWVASMTKIVATIACLQLMEQGAASQQLSSTDSKVQERLVRLQREVRQFLEFSTKVCEAAEELLMEAHYGLEFTIWAYVEATFLF